MTGRSALAALSDAWVAGLLGKTDLCGVQILQTLTANRNLQTANRKLQTANCADRGYLPPGVVVVRAGVDEDPARLFQFNIVLNTMLNSAWFCQR